MRAVHFIRRTLGRTGSVLTAVTVAFVLVACSSDDVPEYVERPVEELYNQAMNTLQAGEYKAAARLFDEVERQHPYSVWASKSQLMAAYSHYQDNAYDDTIAALDRFIQLHPGNRDVSYAYYLKALSYYEQISDIKRDQKMTGLALQSLEELQRRFPESKYARDAALKADLARDHLAGKNMSVGRFYQSRDQHLAAINRFRVVVEQFQTTSHVTEALHRLVECYLALGITREARATAAVLGYNYPGSEWYMDSYALLDGMELTPEEQDDSWIARAWKTTN
ncbi:MAG: outer membrane protein assembly factor BamD [Rhodospirillales bacterium]|nr:outer membrane protein assembly factor BamD [Rhodospirillales bacterium]MDH3916641.1 outer membrane protein assembly factor BamD [Rhodospirillales bacterium]MDH3966847.1 outer membrane protein assembly factor BamD [Rhodospirillales bacterium]